MSQNDERPIDIQVVGVKRVDNAMILVNFSDGTSAFFSAEQLLKLGTSRIKTANWPEGRDYFWP